MHRFLVDRRCAAAAAVTLVAVLAAARLASAEPFALEVENGRAVVAGEVLVELAPNAPRAARAEIEQAEDIGEAKPIGDGRWVRLRSRTRSAATLLRDLARRADVRRIEPNYLVQMQAVPNDPQFVHLWAMRNTGQVVNGHPGVPGADIAATLAWDVTTGSAANVVAVIDTGIDYTHPDLAANVWTAPAPFAVTLGGATITCPAGSHGFNVLTRTCDPLDDNDHGTHVAGTVAAVGNDGVGIVGVNWTAAVMGIKFLDAGGNGTTADAVDAIEFAIQARQLLGSGGNVRVLSNSYVLTGPSQALRDAIDRAELNEMLFVVAAGNFGTDNDTNPIYPQSYATPGMISVAATSQSDLRWGFSNYGAATVHLGAPGFDIVSTTRNGGYAFRNGTSMAAPHVSGTAALMLAVSGTLTVSELKAGILGSVDLLPALQGLTVTGGRLDTDGAVRSVNAGPDFRLDLGTPPLQSVALGGSAAFGITVSARNGFADTVALAVAGLPAGAVATFTPPTVEGTGESTLAVTTSAATSTGSHVLTITGTGGGRVHSLTVTLTVTIGVHLLPGSVSVVSPRPLAKFVARPPRGQRFEPPRGDPTVHGAVLRIFDTSSAAGDDSYVLAAASAAPLGWRGLGSPAGAKGYRYTGAGTADDPCRVVVVRDTVIKARCTGPAVTLRPPFAGALGVILDVGPSDRYCAQFGGDEVRNDGTETRRRNAPAPAACP